MLVPYTFTQEAERLVNEDLIEVSLDRAHGPEDAAYDLCAVHDAVVYTGARDTTMVRTGLRVAIPEGYAGLVLPRSGMANKLGLIIPNSPGLIDPGYRGEILVGFRAHMTYADILQHNQTGGMGKYFIDPGNRIAQLLFIGPEPLTPWYIGIEQFEHEYGDTKRGQDGFGSTGL